MTYNEVRKSVLLMYPELMVCDVGVGVEFPQTYIKVTWITDNSEASCMPNITDSGSYVSGTYNKTGKEFYLVAVGLMRGNQRKRICTLLHEVGHHDSKQNVSTVDKEINAWDRCIELYEVLGLAWTDYEAAYASSCLGSYLNKYGFDQEQLDRILELGLFIDVVSCRECHIKTLSDWKVKAKVLADVIDFVDYTKYHQNEVHWTKYQPSVYNEQRI